MSLESGRKLGPYEILSPLGAGGMGEVYKAKDTRLDRNVAIKVLPEHLADDAAFRERFEREAKAVSGLNHPNICVLHDVGREDGVDYLVMELLDGETLQARLERGPLSLEETLAYSAQIAGALAGAHREGIVHRDLKPGNIIIAASGPKLLDFGLAKLHVGETSNASGLSALPTEQRSLTQAGAVLGTFHYMSPEQLAGKEADARSDIFALGAVLYEMVTGKKVFEAESQAHLITAIMSQSAPGLTSVRAEVPKALERCVAKCLSKEPEGRWHSAHDLRDELEWIASGKSDDTPQASTKARRVHPMFWVAVGIVLGVVVATLVTAARAPTLTQPTTRFVVDLPQNLDAWAGGLTVVPGGGGLVYVEDNQLFRRPLGSFEAAPIAGTEGAHYPFVSPDGRSIGFFAAGRLQRVNLGGGPPVTLAEVGYRWGASWGDDDTIVFAHSNQSNGRLQSISASGGTAVALAGENVDGTERWPELLPGSKGVLYTVMSSSVAEASVAVKSLATGEVKTLLSGTYARYVSTGHILFAWEGSLWAAPFDLERLELAGEPTRLIEHIRVNSGGMALYAAGSDGSLAYMTGARGAASQLYWVSLDGTREPISETGAFSNPELSPDGAHLAVVNEGDIWVFELARNVSSRLTLQGSAVSAVWSPDGRRLAFGSAHRGSFEIFEQLTGSSEAQLVLTEDDSILGVHDWSSDGRNLIYLHQRRSRDVGVLPTDGGDPTLLLETDFEIFHARLSPDRRWLAYTSNESGNHEIYITDFPTGASKWRLSSEGGVQPRWSKNETKIYYLRGDGMLVSVGLSVDGHAMSFDTPEPLFRLGNTDFIGAGLRAQYDVSPEGDRFVVNVNSDNTPQQVRVVLNWFSELERLVPTQ